MRIIASTKRNLLEKIADGTFRQDLYYRLDVLRINIPPLRERLDDVPAAGRAPAGADRQGPPLPDRARGRRGAPAPRLAGQRPRAVPHAGAGLSGRLRAASPPSCSRADSGEPTADKATFPPAVSRRPWTRPSGELLENALRAAGGNKTAAAAALGMKPSTFRDKLAKHGLG